MLKGTTNSSNVHQQATFSISQEPDIDEISDSTEAVSIPAEALELESEFGQKKPSSPLPTYPSQRTSCLRTQKSGPNLVRESGLLVSIFTMEQNSDSTEQGAQRN